MKLHEYFNRLRTGTQQLESVDGKHFITTGCSHTGAIGLDISQGYTQQLAHEINNITVQSVMHNGHKN
jgi:hypothetical protein